MLAEITTTDISTVRNPIGFKESKKIAKEGALAAKAAKTQIEKSTGKLAISKSNARTPKKNSLKKIN